MRLRQRTLILAIVGALGAACTTAAPPPPAPTATPAPAAQAVETPVVPPAATATPPPVATAVAPTATPQAAPTLAPPVAPATPAPVRTLVSGAAARPPQATGPASVATATTAEQVGAPGPATETSAIAARLEAALNTGDVQTALGLFAANAEVKVPPDRYVGATQIADWLNYLAAIHFEIEPGFRRVIGQEASWPAEIRSDYLEKIGLPSLNGDASLVIQDGRIVNYTFFLTEDSARRHRQAVLAASEVLQDPLIVGQQAANVYGFNDVFFDADGKMVSYRDVLTADPGSGPFHDLGGEPIVVRSGY